MMIFSVVAMIGLEKCCITSACLQWLCHSGVQTVACGPLVFCLFFFFLEISRHLNFFVGLARHTTPESRMSQSKVARFSQNRDNLQTFHRIENCQEIVIFFTLSLSLWHSCFCFCHPYSKMLQM